jgi:hypothetical protein
MTVKAVYEDGVLKPKEPLPFKEHEEVEILEIRPAAAPSADDDDPTGWKAARQLIGCITEELTVSDASLNHDRYIYRRDR